MIEETSCRGIHNAGLSVFFTVSRGVRQGFILGDELGDENKEGRAKKHSTDPVAEAAGVAGFRRPH